MKKRLLSCLLCAVMVIGMFPTIALAGDEGAPLSGQDGIVEVPEEQLTWNGTTLTGVNESWLKTLEDGTPVHLVIPEKATSIKNSAFSTNKSTLDQYLYSVDFSKATALTELGTYTFQDCRKLAEITGLENTNITEIPSQAFFECKNLEMEFDLSETGITSIGNNAFCGSGITGMILPDGLKSLGTDAYMPVFGECDKLEYVRTASTKDDETVLLDLPDSLETLGKRAFMLSSKSPIYQALENNGAVVAIPASLTTVYDSAFLLGENEKIYFTFPDGWTAPAGFSERAFGGYAKHVLIFPDLKTYQLGIAHFGERNYAISRVVTLTFEGTDRTEKKLYGASVQYVYDDAAANWRLDQNYTLPDAPKSAGTPADGYRGAWIIDGLELTDTSDVKSQSAEQSDMLTATYDAALVAPPTNIRFTVNGVPQGEADAADQEGSLILEVPATEAAPGRIGIALEHALLKGQDDGGNGPYVYFKYLWYDIQQGLIGGERRNEEGFYEPDSSSSENLSKARTDSEISIGMEDGRVYKDIGSPTGTHANYNLYRVKILGYYVDAIGNETKFYESYCPEFIFGGPLDKMGHTTLDTYGCQVKVVAPTCTVTYELSGGTDTGIYGPVTVNAGETITAAEAPSRSGYSFTGWSDGTTTYQPGASITINTDLTLTAVWNAAQVQVWFYEIYYQFYTPDGTLLDENGVPYKWIRQTYGHGGHALPDEEVSIGHERFDGQTFAWDAIDGSGKETLGIHYVFDEDYGPHRLSALCGAATAANPLKIYYRATPHTVTYQYDGEVPAGAPAVPVVVNTSYSAPVTVAVDPTMSGYTFSGWTVKSPAVVEIKDDKLTIPNNDVVLVGTWTKERPLCTVTYNLNGGTDTGIYDPVTVNAGQAVTAAAAPSRSGYSFTGWSDGTATYQPGASIAVNADLTLTAVWKEDVPVPITYTVTYNLSGGTDTGVYGPVTVNAGKAVTAAAAPSRSGYSFTGWSDGTATYQPGASIAVNADLTLTAVWKEDVPVPITYTVTYNLSGGTDTGVYGPVTVNAGKAVTAAAAPSRSGYSFTGWSDGAKTYQPGDSLTVLSNITLIAQWNKNSSGDGGNGGGATYYILHYQSNGGTEYKDERYRRNTVVELDKAPTREGYTFTGWYADKEQTDRITQIKMTSDKTVYAGWEPTGVPDWLNGKEHFAYVVGYTDGTVRPLNNISRAEVAAIFFRLLNQDIREENLTATNAFTDVNEGMWCNTAISTMERLGIVKGRSPEHFDPDAPITRAEFAVICARFDTSKRDGDSDFTDIDDHWAEAEIERAAALGWIRGYTDGTFRPENNITRAEAMTMINRVLNRLPESEDDLLDGMNVWPDNQPGAWYYLAVQEATNSHDFNRKDDGYEHWTKLTADSDWAKYQN